MTTLTPYAINVALEAQRDKRAIPDRILHPVVMRGTGIAKAEKCFALGKLYAARIALEFMGATEDEAKAAVDELTREGKNG